MADSDSESDVPAYYACSMDTAVADQSQSDSDAAHNGACTLSTWNHGKRQYSMYVPNENAECEMRRSFTFSLALCFATCSGTAQDLHQTLMVLMAKKVHLNNNSRSKSAVPK